MKIIFLEAVQNHGGARMSTLGLAKRMKDLGHDVLIVDLWGADENFNNDVRKHGLKYKIIDPRNKPFAISNKSKFKTFKNIIIYSHLQKFYRKKIKEIINEFDAGTVSVNNVKCLNLLNARESYNIDFHIRTWLSREEIDFKTRHILNKYKPRYICVSQSTRHAAFNAGFADLCNIKVLHDVINENDFINFQPIYEEFNTNRPIKILHSGGFLKTKGQHISIEVARQLKEKSIPFKLTITGVTYTGGDSDNYLERIKDLINIHKLNDYVELVINRYDILEYFKTTDILLHPSYTEGLPRVALEAFSYGKPVIANPVGGVTDVVINNYTGFLTDFNNIEQYVSCILKYFERETYVRHSINCRNLIRSEYLTKNQLEMIKYLYPS